MGQAKNEELTLRDLVDVSRKRWLLVSSTIVVVMGLALAATLIPDPVYQAEAKVLLQDSPAQLALNPANVSNLALSRELSNEIAFALSDTVFGKLEAEEGRDLERMVVVRADSTSDVLVFEGNGNTPEEAAELANRFAALFVGEKRTQALNSIDDAIEQLSARLAAAESERIAVRQPIADLEDDLVVATPEQSATIANEIDRLTVERGSQLSLLDGRVQSLSESLTRLEITAEVASLGTAQVGQIATPPLEGSATPLARNLVLGLLAGIAVAAGVVGGREGLDSRVRSVQDVEALGLPVLAAIPRVKERMGNNSVATLSSEDPEHAVATAYHRLRTVLKFSTSTLHLTSLLITSPSESEGKTTTVVNLAGSFAHAGDFTAVVEADLRRPRFAEIYGTPRRTGVTRYLAGDIAFEELGTTPMADEHLVVIPSGPLPVSATNTITHPAFKDMLDLIEKDADVVLIDSPPVLRVPDALELAHMVDGVVLVARSGVTRSSELLAAHESLRKVSANVLGVVLTQTKDRTLHYRYEHDQPRHSITRPAQWIQSTFALPGRLRSR